MTGTYLDASINLKKETTFGTNVTPDTAYEFVSETFDYVPTYAQGIGHHAGSRVQDARTRVLVKEEASGDLEIEATTLGMGKLFEAALGVGASTQASGAAYQQRFTPLVDDYLPSYTIQKSVPLLAGAVQAHTFGSMVCSGFEFTAGNAAIPTIKFSFMGKSLTTATPFASLTYPSGNKPFSFVNASMRIGGSVTPPTTTALASGGTAATNVREFNLSYSNNLDSEGFNFGASGQRARKPAVGQRSITGSFTAEFDATTLRDAFINQTDLALVFKVTHGTAITGAYYPTLEFTIPNIRLEGELPKASFDGVVTQSISYTGLDDGSTAHPIYVAIVTSETAI